MQINQFKKRNQFYNIKIEIDYFFETFLWDNIICMIFVIDVGI